MKLRSFLVSAAAGYAFLFAANDASAAFHQMKIVEVYGGANGAHYVQLEMTAAGQTQLAGHAITVFDTNDVLVDTVNLANVTNGDLGATILIGTDKVEATYDVKPDFATLKPLNPAGGKVCFDAVPVDCFTWGGYPNKTGFGAPFAALGADAAKRDVSRGDVTKLDGPDDTDDSAADFDASAPNPRSNVREAASASSSSSSSSSGSTTNPPPSTSSSSSTSSSTGGAPTATSSSDEGGCSTTSNTSGGIAAPLLALAAIAAMRKRTTSRSAPRTAR